MIIFDGITTAAEQETTLKSRVEQLEKQPQVAAILFQEDAGSRLYTRLKKEAAERVGIGYHLYQFSLHDPIETVLKRIHELNNNTDITGIIIQKPMRGTWLASLGMEQGSETKEAYNNWWGRLVGALDPNKDVDGLHPTTLAAIMDNSWTVKGRVLPATCRAVVDILADFCAVESGAGISEIEPNNEQNNATDLRALNCLENKKIIILGKSDLLGKPLYYYLHNSGFNVEMIGSKELADRVEKGESLFDADVVVTATGRHQLIRGELLKNRVAIIDVGEPKPDVDFESVKDKVSFITPVPGGVGPMTVVSLMKNAVELVER